MSSVQTIRSVFYRDYTHLRTIGGSWNQAYYIWLGYFTGSAAGGANIKDIDVDWVRVRKFTSVEPTVRAFFPITQLVITTSEQTITKNQVSEVITVETQAAEGITSAVTSDVTLNLTTTSGNRPIQSDRFPIHACDPSHHSPRLFLG